MSPKTGLGPISKVLAISVCPDFFMFSLIRGVLCLNGLDFLNFPVLVQFDKITNKRRNEDISMLQHSANVEA